MAIKNCKGQCGISSSSWPLYNVSGAGFLGWSKACVRAGAFHTLSVVQLAFGSTWTHTGTGEVRTHQRVFLLTLWREQKILNALFLYTQIHSGCFVGCYEHVGHCQDFMCATLSRSALKLAKVSVCVWSHISRCMHLISERRWACVCVCKWE